MTAQLSRERIEQYLQSAEGQKISDFDSVKMIAVEPDYVIALCRLALAGMDSKPVACMIGGHYLMHAHDPKIDNYSSAVPLYTTPPAPVAVPDDVASRLPEIMRTGKANRWEIQALAKACLAGMLNDGPVTAATVPDGWKLVPVDPTKDMLRAGQSVVGFWLNTVHCYSKMLAAAPAAPEQEV